MSVVPMVPDLPTGRIGLHEVERFEVTPMGSAIGSFSYRERTPTPGTYTRLVRHDPEDSAWRRVTVMSDTDAERHDHIAPVLETKERGGHVLINGLGLGLVLNACLLNDAETVTVVELCQEVIDLVGPHYLSKFPGRIKIIRADALERRPARGERYSVAWHDIWDHICSDNLPEMHTLHRRYGRRTEWQGSWARELCEYQRRIGI